MAISASARITGTVLRTTSRDWSKKDPETGKVINSGTIRTVLIVGEETMGNVRWNDDKPLPTAGEVVDIIVELSAYKNDAECTYVADAVGA